MRTIRAEFDAASSASPAPPVAMPIPAVGSPAVPGRVPQADIIKAFIETATMHGCCRTIPETLICEDPKQFGVAVFQGIVHIRRPS
jgi:hypothetical protein